MKKIILLFTLLCQSFAAAKLSDSLFKTDLDNVSFGIKILTPQSSIKDLGSYRVEAHLLKVISVNGINFETNVLFHDGVAGAKLQGVASKKFNNLISLGLRAESDLTSIDYIEHELYVKIHNIISLNELTVDAESIIDTKARGFKGAILFFNIRKLSIGVGTDSGQLATLIRVKLN